MISEDFHRLKENALVMLRQEDMQVRVAHLFASYLSIVQPIVNTASVQNAGVRPECLENEIYSCFHHIARGLCCKEDFSSALNEVKKGEDSHLKRLLLDAYKLAIRPQLEEYAFIVEELYSLSLDKDFNPDVFGTEPIKKVRNILDIKNRVKDAYQEAKHNEAMGDIGKAVVAFEHSLSDCYALRIAIDELMKEDIFIVAKAHVARKQAEKEKDRRENRWRFWISQGIALAAVAVSTVALFKSCAPEGELTTAEATQEASVNVLTEKEGKEQIQVK